MAGRAGERVAAGPGKALRAGAIGIGALICGLALASVARAEEKIIISHGISTFGDLKLPADFTHLPYVNPNAPKGGEISQWAPGSFDSFNPYTIQGNQAVLSSIFYESILAGTADDVSAAYCLLCETMEYPEDRSWVIFNLRKDVTFSDGSPFTAEDVLFSYELFRDKGIPEFRSVSNGKYQSVEVLDSYRIKFTFTPGTPFRDMPVNAGGTTIFSNVDFSNIGNAELKAFFSRMARFSRLHLAQAVARGGFRELPVLRPEDYDWPEGTSPETAEWMGVDAQMDAGDALRLALDSEHRGHAYYAAIAATTQDAELCALAGEFAAEEAQHVMELERIIASRTAA